MEFDPGTTSGTLSGRSRSRRRPRPAVAALVVVLLAPVLLLVLGGPATAQDEDPGGVYVQPDEQSRPPAVETFDPDVAGNQAVAPADAAVLGGQQERSSLPVTGGDVVGLVAIAALAVIGGTALVVVRRRRLADPVDLADA